jgi:hypothetical protein
MVPAGADPSPRTFRLLRWTGWALLALTVLGLLAEAPAGQLGSRIAGAALVGTTGVAAVVAARLARRRPAWGRWLGLLSAGGMLLTGWLVTTRPTNNLLTVVIGLALVVVGSVVAWQLVRRRAAGSSGQAEDGSNVA